jgi:superfamily II DNA/RNA helicase
MITFDKLQLILPIKEALQKQGYSIPTPIQAQGHSTHPGTK